MHPAVSIAWWRGPPRLSPEHEAADEGVSTLLESH